MSAHVTEMPRPKVTVALKITRADGTVEDIEMDAESIDVGLIPVPPEVQAALREQLEAACAEAVARMEAEEQA